MRGAQELSVDTPAGPRILGLTVTPLEGGGGAHADRLPGSHRAAPHRGGAQAGRPAGRAGHAGGPARARNPQPAGRDARLGADARAGRRRGAELGQAGRRSSCASRTGSPTLVEDFLRFARPPPPAQARAGAAGAGGRDGGDAARRSDGAPGASWSWRSSRVRVPVDADQLRQVLHQPLAQRLRRRRAPEGRVRVRLEPRRGATCELRVWDSAGQHLRRRIWRAFSSPSSPPSEGGTGLGLSTAHSIVARARRRRSGCRSSAAGRAPSSSSSCPGKGAFSERRRGRAHPGRR